MFAEMYSVFKIRALWIPNSPKKSPKLVKNDREMALRASAMIALDPLIIQRCQKFRGAMKNDVQTSVYRRNSAVLFYLALRATPAPIRLRTFSTALVIEIELA